MFSSSSSSGGGGGGGFGGGAGAGAGDGGCGCGSNGNGGGGSSGVWSSGMKKQQKRPKIPKRGPGVAELEKILREQEQSGGGINTNNINTTSSNINNDDDVEGFSVSHSCFSLRPHSPPPLKPHCPPHPPPPPAPTPLPPRPPPPPPSRHIPIAPRFDHLNPQPLPPAPPPSPPGIYGYNTAKQQQGRSFPEQPLFPMNPSSCDGLSQPDSRHQHLHHSANSSSTNFYSESSNNHHLWSSYSSLPHKRHSTNQYSSTMVKLILGPCAPPPPSPSSLTTGFFNHEPPSNQSSYINGISRNPTEEPKMVGMKRPHPSSSFENSLVPSSTLQVSPFFSNLTTRPHNKSSPHDSHNLTYSNNDTFRDGKWGGPLGFNSNRSRFGSEMSNGGSGHSNFSSLINGAAAAPSSPVPSPPMPIFQRELCNNNSALPNYQVPDEIIMEGSNQKSESSSGGSDQQRCFYNFLEVKEVGGRRGTKLGSNHEGSEVAGINGPDLTLKL